MRKFRRIIMTSAYPEVRVSGPDVSLALGQDVSVARLGRVIFQAIGETKDGRWFYANGGNRTQALRRLRESKV